MYLIVRTLLKGLMKLILTRFRLLDIDSVTKQQKLTIIRNLHSITIFWYLDNLFRSNIKISFPTTYNGIPTILLHHNLSIQPSYTKLLISYSNTLDGLSSRDASLFHILTITKVKTIHNCFMIICYY